MTGFRSLDEGESVKFTVRVGKSGLEAAGVAGYVEPLKGSSIRPLGKKKDKMIRLDLGVRGRITIFTYLGVTNAAS